MSNFQSIVGGMGWAFVSLLLVFAALEPVSIESEAEVAAVASAEQAPRQSANI